MNEQMMALAAIAENCFQFVVQRKVLAAIAGGVT